MAKNIWLSIDCPDQKGLIASISGLLFDLNINLSDTYFALRGESAELKGVCELPETMSLAELKQQLQRLPVLAKANIVVSEYTASKDNPDSNSLITHQVTLQGADQPGLVARLTEVFIDYEANIVSMGTHKIDTDSNTQYLIRLAVAIPAARAEACLATVSSTATWLNMQSSWNAIDD